jgi:hypothetical protein
MPSKPVDWHPAPSLVTAAAGAAAYSRREAEKNGTEARKRKAPPAFGASRPDPPPPRAHLDARDIPNRSRDSSCLTATATASVSKAAAKAAASAAPQGTFLKDESQAPSVGDEVARVAGSFLKFANSLLDGVAQLVERAQAAKAAAQTRASDLRALCSPRRARGVAETKVQVTSLLDECEAALADAEAAGLRNCLPLRDQDDQTEDEHPEERSDEDSIVFSDLEWSDEAEVARRDATFDRAIARALSRAFEVAKRQSAAAEASGPKITEAAKRGAEACDRAAQELDPTNHLETSLPSRERDVRGGTTLPVGLEVGLSTTRELQKSKAKPTTPTPHEPESKPLPESPPGCHDTFEREDVSCDENEPPWRSLSDVLGAKDSIVDASPGTEPRTRGSDPPPPPPPPPPPLAETKTEDRKNAKRYIREMHIPKRNDRRRRNRLASTTPPKRTKDADTIDGMPDVKNKKSKDFSFSDFAFTKSRNER